MGIDSLCETSEEKIESETSLYPSRLYAVKFSEEDKGKGAYLLLTRTQGISFRGGIYIVREKDLSLLDRNNVKYEKYLPKTNEVTELYEHFGVETSVVDTQKSLIRKIFSYLSK